MKKLSNILTVVLLLELVTLNVYASKIYSCKNTAGKMVFQDSPCEENSQQIKSRKIDAKKSSGATINRAICRKSIQNIHKYLLPKLVEKLSADEVEKLVSKNIEQCIKQHTEKDYQEILCYSRANSAATAGLCARPPE
jgi:Domain of unknown function (DUF4124)